jgi:hypothetical protein
MSFNLKIIHTSDFVRLNGKGEYDQAESRQMLRSLATRCIASGIDCALIDVRDARSDMQMVEIYELALTFKEIGFHEKQRLAILYRSTPGERVEFFAMNPGERARFFAMCAAEQGWNVKAFDEFEPALEWLGATCASE